MVDNPTQVLRIKHPLGESVWHDGPVRVGRTPDNQLVVNDESLSRHHAEINPTRNGWLIRDLQSANGIWVKGVRVPSHRLRSGDTLVLGTVSLQVLDAAVARQGKSSPLRVVLLASIVALASYTVFFAKEEDPAAAYKSVSPRVFEARIPPPPANVTPEKALAIAKKLIQDKDRSGASVANARRALQWAKALSPDQTLTGVDDLQKEIDASLDERLRKGRLAYIQSAKLGDRVGAESALRMLRETFPYDDPRSIEIEKLERQY